VDEQKQLTRSGPIIMNTAKILVANIEAVIAGEIVVAVTFDGVDIPTLYRDSDASAVAAILMAESRCIDAV
jgi:hypothetical protein